ncbi:hypothetical protein BCR33DRAFT_716531 [Rhizoclosmatium globosum]|uniref:Uncharacterized protein n=1 Tax=Rhizoclosmatium globosum TaxID=329046 RepID=A0A1Y2CEJ1_9FUNG|nr:hypothetical protein BCR33DRAFT_716531 [Rhizoclosmatium globosum]|eukprot:ORY45224.1 hypothetical protein BCR33DRAFT_716531 [Rhizoclosmatium globosum]
MHGFFSLMWLTFVISIFVQASPIPWQSGNQIVKFSEQVQRSFFRRGIDIDGHLSQLSTNAKTCLNKYLGERMSNDLLWDSEEVCSSYLRATVQPNCSSIKLSLADQIIIRDLPVACRTYERRLYANKVQ